MKFKHRINIFLYNQILEALNINSVVSKNIIGYKFIRRDIVFDFDRTFDSNFPKNQEFKFIQIGGNDGVSFDTLYSKVTGRNSIGLILEPSPRYFEKLQLNYQNFKSIKLLPFAIFEKSGSLELFELNEIGLKNHPYWAAGIGSVDINHLTNLDVKMEEIERVKVDGITFDDLLGLHPEFLNIDYLQIDTEGYDFQILSYINFQKFNAKMIKFEFKNLSASEQKKAISIFRKDYFLYQDELDLVCIRKNLRIKCRI
ncbi:MAG: FkbM family methyltransferase [Cyclobacteriaceae bacterium]